jgi:hypothetical protein
MLSVLILFIHVFGIVAVLILAIMILIILILTIALAKPGTDPLMTVRFDIAPNLQVSVQALKIPNSKLWLLSEKIPKLSVAGANATVACGWHLAIE